MIRRALLIVALLSSAACGGGGGTTALAPAVNHASPQAATTAKFTLTVPAASAQAHARTPSYISTATASVIITLTTVNGTAYSGSPASIATNLTTSSSGCSNAGSTLTCTILAPAIAGNDTFTIATYDTQQSSSAPASPAGQLLSQATLVIAVTAGQANAPATPLILNGVAASYTTVFPANVHIAGTQTTGYQIAGNWPYTFSIEALDADHNIIVGPGTPTLTVASASTAVSVAPATGTPNTFTLQVQHYSASAVAINITPSNGTAAAVSVTTVPELWVANGSVNAVAAYALWPGASPALLPDAVSTQNEPYGIAFDASGNLWVGNRSSDSIGEFAAQTLTPVQNISGTGNATQIAFDANGNLWSADNAFGDDIVIEHSPPIGGTVSRQIATGALPFGVAIDGQQNVWVSTDTPNAITEFVAPAYTAATVITDGHNPYGLAFDASGNLWVANSASDAVVEYAPPFTGPPITTVPVTTIGSPIGIGFDPAGNLWVSNGGTAIAEYTTPGFTLGSTIADANSPNFMAFTP